MAYLNDYLYHYSEYKYEKIYINNMKTRECKKVASFQGSRTFI